MRKTLTVFTGRKDDYEAAWRDGWTDACWIGAWLEDLPGDGQPGPGLTRDPSPPLALPLPNSLAARLEEAIEAWAIAADGRAAEFAKLTGWTRCSPAPRPD